MLLTYKVVSFQRCWSWTKWRLLFTKIWRKRTENINELKKKNILKFTLFLITGNSKFQITKSPRRFSNLDGKFCKLYPQKITLTCTSLVPRNNDPKEHWWTENCVSIMAVPFKNTNANNRPWSPNVMQNKLGWSAWYVLKTTWSSGQVLG